jgi:hypothetical protein
MIKDNDESRLKAFKIKSRVFIFKKCDTVEVRQIKEGRSIS